MAQANKPLELEVVRLGAGSLFVNSTSFKVIGPMAGDHVHATGVWIPSTKTLIARDLGFNQVHLWFGEHDAATITDWSNGCI